VIGRITGIYEGIDRKGRPYAFLNLGEPGKGFFSVVLWVETLKTFKQADISLDSLKGQWVSVTGVISIHKGKAQCVIDMPAQIQRLGSGEMAEMLLLTNGKQPTPQVTPTNQSDIIPKHKVDILDRLYNPSQFPQAPAGPGASYPTGSPLTPPPTTQSTSSLILAAQQTSSSHSSSHSGRIKFIILAVLALSLSCAYILSNDSGLVVSREARLLIGSDNGGKVSREPLDVSSRLSLRGIGPIKIGMTLQDAQSTLGKSLAQDNEQADTGTCSYFVPQDGPKGVSFMVINRKIVRIDISTKRIKTMSGAQIGDTESKVLSLYRGHIEIQAHRYNPNGHYLVFHPSDQKDQEYGMVFETNGSKVTTFRSGRHPEVDYVEHCL